MVAAVDPGVIHTIAYQHFGRGSIASSQDSSCRQIFIGRAAGDFVVFDGDGAVIIAIGNIDFPCGPPGDTADAAAAVGAFQDGDRDEVGNVTYIR